jgi:hypothetical protein
LYPAAGSYGYSSHPAKDAGRAFLERVKALGRKAIIHCHQSILLVVQETLYIDDIEQREDAGTPAILQKMRAALAFWIKSCIGADTIQSTEKALIHTALERLARSPKVEVLGNCEVRQFWYLANAVTKRSQQICFAARFEGSSVLPNQIS